MALDDDRLVFYHTEAGSPPGSQSVQYRNIGGGTLSPYAETDSPWIDVATISVGEHGFALVSVDTTGLSHGFHTGIVRLNSAPGSGILFGAPRCIRVEAWVSNLRRYYLPLVLRGSNGELLPAVGTITSQ
jgi:hypothetical protein